MNALGGTFRDPSGSLFDERGQILRLVHPQSAPSFDALIGHEVLRGLVERGALVDTQRLEQQSIPSRLQGLHGTWYGHERVQFASMPCEWPAAMLAQAALHTLDINAELIPHGYILKDATPSNVLFDDARPVFVDVPSIEPLVPGHGVWLARHQFETTFLLPLMGVLEAGLPLTWTLANPATGISHEQFAKILGFRRWLGASRIRQVALPAALGRARSNVRPPTEAAAASAWSVNKSKYIIGRSVIGLRQSVAELARRVEGRRSIWSGYATDREHYADRDLEQKREFVGQVLERANAKWVVDVGANTGEFSEMAAVAGARVVAIDLDEVSVSAIYARAQSRKLAIQPLVVNLAQPTPPAGWRNDERKSFLQRATGRFQLSMMLAVGHHLRVSAGVPLAEIVDGGLALGSGSLLFEFVPGSDPMFRAIARGREMIYTDYTQENCEALLRARGRIELSKLLPNGRTLYWIRQA